MQAQSSSDAKATITTAHISPSALNVSQALIEPSYQWRIHNCKLSEKMVTQEATLPFLYHYDRLGDDIKQKHPLTPQLLAKFNTPMSSEAAAQLIGVDTALIAKPWHVKVIGSLVVFSEALQLAVRLHWSNTGQQSEPIYTKTKDDALLAAFKDWQFFGRVDVLYKNANQALISLDDSQSQDAVLTILPANEYQKLPPMHALAVLNTLEENKAKLPWFETAILARIE